uniref:Uncharacterized protein n=1 Tax=Oryza glaberrima TaxID=4538 RepID=I1PM63_ORYGL
MVSGFLRFGGPLFCPFFDELFAGCSDASVCLCRCRSGEVFESEQEAEEDFRGIGGEGTLARIHTSRNYSNMPEMRDSKRTALGELSGGGGFFIRRVASPGALAARGPGKPLARRFIRPSNNKENVPPVWAVKATATKRRSPLPDWYPRTPLRDITAIAKAIQRSRLRIAAAQQRSQTPEQNTPHCTEVRDSLDVEPGINSTQIVATPASSLAKDSLKIFSSPSETSLITPSKPMDPVLLDDMEKKLSSSIEQIEKMVRRNLKRTPKAAAAQPSKRAIQRRTLMLTIAWCSARGPSSRINSWKCQNILKYSKNAQYLLPIVKHQNCHEEDWGVPEKERKTGVAVADKA